MESRLFELLSRVTRGRGLNVDVFLPEIKADITNDFDEKNRIIYSLSSQPNGDNYPPIAYEEYFKGSFNVLLQEEREFWLNESYDFSQIKYFNLAKTKLSIINTHIDLLRKGKNDISSNTKNLELITYLIESLSDLAWYFRLVIKKLKSISIHLQQEKIRLNLSVRDIAFLLKILKDQKIVDIRDQELKKTFKVIINSFITKGKEEDNTVDGLKTKWDTYNIIDNVDAHSYKKIKELIEQIQKKLESLEESNPSLKEA